MAQLEVDEEKSFALMKSLRACAKEPLFLAFG